ncbi:MAG: peptidoglycan DD-metalloendopeptidase family protein [Deltaproteobacteria bacterium]|nr:peptidoglycan DD-metalloendopeptidase family protein [Deltaproteobacteria bacterium]
MFWKLFLHRPFPQKVAFALLFLFCVGGSLSGTWADPQTEPAEELKALEANRSRLKEIQENLQKKKGEVKQLEQKERSLLGNLTKIDKQIETNERELATLQKNWDRLNEEKNQTEENIEILQTNIQDLRGRSMLRVRSFYKATRGGILRVLFSADSLSSAARRLEFSQAIIAQDLKTLEQLSLSLIELQNQEQALQTQNEQLTVLFNEMRGLQDLLAKERGKKLSFLASLRRQKELSRKAIVELEQSSKDIETLIQEVEANLKKRLSPTFADRKGGLELPAAGKIIGTFGQAFEPGLQQPYFRSGIDIAAAMGAEVRAIHAGQVIYADWLDGYGKALIIDHGGGYHTVSSHLSEILKQVGDTVSKGEVVGLVGDTGSIKGAYLYFEIRFNGKATDPLDWLGR